MPSELLIFCCLYAGFSHRANPCLLFVLGSFPVDERGTMKAVVEYFRETYGFVIRHTQLPCLQVGNTQRPNYLPMEVGAFLIGN